MSAFKGQFNKKQPASYAEPGLDDFIDDFIFDEDDFEIPDFTLKAVDDLRILDFIWARKNGLQYNIRIDAPNKIHAEQIASTEDKKSHKLCNTLKFTKDK